MLYGYLWSFGGASIFTGMLIALGHLALYPMLSNTKAIKQIWVKSRADRLKNTVLSATSSATA
jgi:hypothetical protein